MKIRQSFIHPWSSSKLLWICFFCWTQKKIFWRMLVTRQVNYSVKYHMSCSVEEENSFRFEKSWGW